MGREFVSDELRGIIEPLLPAESPKPKGGRPRVSDRAALAGIVLKSSTPWKMLPKEMGRGSGSTCWRRLHDWQEVGCGACTGSCSTDLARPSGSTDPGRA